MNTPRMKAQVIKELEAMQSVGMRVPPRAFDLAAADATYCDESAAYMGVGELADMIVEMSE